MTTHPPEHHILRAEHYARCAADNRREVDHLALRQHIHAARHFDAAGDIRALEQYDAAVWLLETMEHDADALEAEHRRREGIGYLAHLPEYDVPVIDAFDLERRRELIELVRPSAPVGEREFVDDDSDCPFGVAS